MTHSTRPPLPIGISFFDKVIERGAYYIDKTLFIQDLLDRDASVTLCTRPRRFGKTLNQTMLKCFFEDMRPFANGEQEAVRYSNLFNGLKIESAGERYMAEQGKYPVVFLSFKEAKHDSFEISFSALREKILSEITRQTYALEGEHLNGTALNHAKYLLSLNRQNSSSDFMPALEYLCECLTAKHGVGAIVLIDEYDVP
jgi:hypothetical protein